MEVYKEDGTPVHEPDLDHSQQQTVVINKKSYRTVAAKRKRVVEYLVLQRKLWTTEHWYVKEQLWPTAGRKVAI